MLFKNVSMKTFVYSQSEASDFYLWSNFSENNLLKQYHALNMVLSLLLNCNKLSNIMYKISYFFMLNWSEVK